MQSELLKKLYPLEIVAALSFLLLYKSGDTISTFLFVMLIVLPFLIKDNMAGIFDISDNIMINTTVNLIFVSLIYAAVFYLLRSGFKKKSSNKIDILCCFSIIICCSYAFKIYYGETQTIFSIITIVFFSLCSLTTLYILLTNIYDRVQLRERSL